MMPISEIDAAIDAVFETNPELRPFDHRKEYPWAIGYLGDVTYHKMFIAENPSLAGLRKTRNKPPLQDPEMQWCVSPGDVHFREGLVLAHCKEGEPRDPGGWRCYITNIVKMAAQPKHWKQQKRKHSAEVIKTIRAFAPVLQAEIDLVEPTLVVVMGEDAQWFFDTLRGREIVLPPECQVKHVIHYGELNYHPRDEAKLQKYLASFAELRGDLTPNG
jgi:hypothetical protein